MSVHLFDCSIAGTPTEPTLVDEVTVRLIEDSERERFDEELVNKHYLKNANAVGRVLRYVPNTVGNGWRLLTFNSAAYHIKPRDQWLHWRRRKCRSAPLSRARRSVLENPANGQLGLRGSQNWRARAWP